MNIALPGAPTTAPLFAQGYTIAVRQVRADDSDRLTDLLTRLSARTCHQRYLAVRSFTPASARAEAERIAAARTCRHIALVANTLLLGTDEVVGVVELARLDEEEGVGELAVVVRDDMQGRGVGSLLMRAIATAAAPLGVTTLHIELLTDNSAMRHLAARVGGPVIFGRGGGVLQLRVHLDTPAIPCDEQIAAGQPGVSAYRRAA